jgi:hypothetical protein
MPDIFDQVADGGGDVFDEVGATGPLTRGPLEPAPAPGDAEGVKAWLENRYPAQKGAISRFFSGLGEALNPVPAIKAGWAAAEKMTPSNPLTYLGPAGMAAQFAKDSLIPAQVEQFKKAGAEAKHGNVVPALGYALAGALPAIGPAAANAGEKIAEGDTAGGLGSGLGTAASVVVPAEAGRIASKVKATSEVPGVSRRLYQSALKPQTGAALSEADRAKIIETGVREGIPVTPRGLQRVESVIEDLNREVGEKIAERSEQMGPTIRPKDVAQRVEETRPTFEQQVNPADDVAALDKSKAEFTAKHTEEIPYTKIEPSLEDGKLTPVGEGVIKQEKPLTLSGAQAEKVGTYRQLRKKYGELGSASTEAQKALARGLKEEIYARFPELKALNAREGALIGLEEQLARYVARHGNRDMVGIGTPIKMLPGGKLAGLALGALEFPGIKSRLAIALDRAAQATRGALPSAPAIGGTIPFVTPRQNNGTGHPALSLPQQP